MKLNKLTSAVSVSLLAVALTACGGSDNGDEGPILTPSPAVTPAPTPSVTPTPTPAAGSTAAELTAALTAAGLTNANAAALIAANPGLTVGSVQYTSLLAQKLAEQNAAANNTGTNTAVSPTVVKANPNIKGVDTNKFFTVAANQYSRQPGSNYDRPANPSQLGGLGAIGTDDPTTSNPYLSNYVLGVEVVGGRVVAIDSTGEMAYQAGANKAGTIIQGNRSPYIEKGGLQYTAASLDDGPKAFNYAIAANTQIPGAPPSANSAAASSAAGDAYDKSVANIATADLAAQLVTAGQAAAPTIYTIQQVNAKNSLVSIGNRDGALNVAKTLNPTALTRNTSGQTRDASGDFAGAGIDSGLIVYNAASIAVGNADGAKLGYKVPVYGVEENIYNADGIALNSVNTFQAESAPAQNDANRDINTFLAKELVQHSANNHRDTAAGGQLNGSGNENNRETYYVEKFRSTADVVNNNGVARQPFTSASAGAANDVMTSIGNANSEKNLANAVANNLETRIFGKNYRSLEAGATGTQDTENSYAGRYNSKGELSSIGLTTLHNTQYGRLTNNIDVLDNKTASSPETKVYRQFQQHGADNTVDSYFYRGTNHTTLANMENLKARGLTVQYYGHALTYGVGPKVEETKAGTVPTSYGLGSGEATIGNFVQAKFDTAKGRVDGTVYNFINSKLTADTRNNKDFKRQDLISFGGDVYGNTVTGTATKAGTTEQGTFTGSFFGTDAQELGGSITSISRAEGYAQPKWGAVFGATKGSAVENFNVIEQAQ